MRVFVMETDAGTGEDPGMRILMRVCWMWLLVVLAVPVVSVEAAETKRQVVLLVGQSNMAGRAALAASDKEAIPNASLWDIKNKKWVAATAPFNRFSPHGKGASMQRLNCGPSFVRTYQEENPGVSIGVICAARGGTNIVEWRKGREKPWPLYDTAVAATKAALADGESELIGILWHQGESNSSKSAAYPAQLKTLVKNFREDLDAPDVPFVFSQLGPWREDYAAFNKMIVLQPDAIPDTACVDTTGLTGMDKAHFDARSQRLLGKRYAEALQGLETGK